MKPNNFVSKYINFMQSGKINYTQKTEYLDHIFRGGPRPSFRKSQSSHKNFLCSKGRFFWVNTEEMLRLIYSKIILSIHVFKDIYDETFPA